MSSLELKFNCVIRPIIIRISIGNTNKPKHPISLATTFNDVVISQRFGKKDEELISKNRDLRLRTSDQMK